ncbi:MAG: hypothetical protein EBV02_07595, partial [Actinobacteria bacterium]|nr:hypothetical protein [Actinomycetota bacterium]
HVSDADAQTGRRRGSSESIENIEVATDAIAHLGPTPGELRLRCIDGDGAGIVTTKGHHIDVCRVGNLATVCIVSIQHSERRVGRREEACLGRKVGVVSAMEVEMIMTEVGEDRCRKVHASNSLQCKCV